MTPPDPISLARRLAARLPSADMQALARAAAQGPTGLRTLRARTGSLIMQRACEQALACLSRCSGDYLAGALSAAADTAAEAARTQRLDVVWTGPHSNIATSRLTSPVVVSLINEAHEEIILVSYATYPEPTIAQALTDASNRGVQITLLLERSSDNPSFSGNDAPFQGLTAHRWNWPADRRDPGASLHAKILLIDTATALISSANFTQRAMETNLECGILIRGGPYPRDIRKHLISLKEQGIFRLLARLSCNL